MKKIYIVGLILIFTFLNSFSQNYYSILDGGGMPGDWSFGTYWSLSSGGSSCSCVPSVTSNVAIEEDMNLDISLTNGNAYGGIMTIESGVSLSTLTNNYLLKSGGILNVYGTLEVWDLEFSNGSFVYVDAGGQIIVHNNLTNKNNSDNVELNGSISVTGTFYNGNGGVVFGTGSLSAGTFTGTGTTFGIQPNSSILAGSTVPLPLPVELISFSAELKSNKTVEINWTTSSETNNDYFSILRSSDGRNFEAIQTEKGAGNSNYQINYFIVDKNPLQGISYYILKQTDFDGKFEYSNIVAVKNSDNSIVNNGSINIYPNPVSHDQDLFITLNGLGSEKEVLVVVIDILGQELYSKILVTNFNGNTVSAIDPNKSLPSGTYIIIGTSENSVYKKNLIIK